MGTKYDYEPQKWETLCKEMSVDILSFDNVNSNAKTYLEFIPKCLTLVKDIFKLINDSLSSNTSIYGMDIINYKN